MLPAQPLNSAPCSARCGRLAWWRACARQAPFLRECVCPPHTRCQTSARRVPGPGRSRVPRQRLAGEVLTRHRKGLAHADRRFPRLRSVDLVADCASRFPVNVIAGMLGLDAADYARFHRWYTTVIAFLGNPAGDPEVAKAGERTRVEFADYMLPIIRDRRKDPGDDLLSTLCTAEVALPRRRPAGQGRSRDRCRPPAERHARPAPRRRLRPGGARRLHPRPEDLAAPLLSCVRLIAVRHIPVMPSRPSPSRPWERSRP